MVYFHADGTNLLRSRQLAQIWVIHHFFLFFRRRLLRLPEERVRTSAARLPGAPAALPANRHVLLADVAELLLREAESGVLRA